jgi:hypothetical protein
MGVSGHIGEIGEYGITLLNLVTSAFLGAKGALKDYCWSPKGVFASVIAYKFNSSRQLSKLNTCVSLKFT